MAEAARERDADVVIVGSGAGGLLAAVRAHDLGLKPIVIEKSPYVGGTSAYSGGQFWIPENHLMQKPGDASTAKRYLRAIIGDKVPQAKIDAYLNVGPEMAYYLESIGVKLESVAWPDYFSEVEGGTGNRALVPANRDADSLGAQIHDIREPPAVWKIFDRYVMDTTDLGPFAMRIGTWRLRFAKMFTRYWLDIGWRLKSYRDRRMTMGNALIGGLCAAMSKRNIPLWINCPLVRLMSNTDGVTGVVVRRQGNELFVPAARGIVLAAGGFEHNQGMRDRYHAVSTNVANTLTPPGANTGDAIQAAQQIAAAIEFSEHAWWWPVVILPRMRDANTLRAHPAFRLPHSLCVNRKGDRFVNESCSYDRFGNAMIADQLATQANNPCWFIFDTHFRQRFALGELLPKDLLADSRVPDSWWDRFIFCASTVTELANKISVDPHRLNAAVTAMNRAALTGIDEQFGRGSTEYDRATSGDPRLAPNPCLGPVDKPPFYAARIELGDIGTKGGIKTDERARVLSTSNQLILRLFATGNTTGSVFADTYPGPGATLGPALVFAFIAANELASADARSRVSVVQEVDEKCLGRS